jgi:hypothetical protein
MPGFIIVGFIQGVAVGGILVQVLPVGQDVVVFFLEIV